MGCAENRPGFQCRIIILHPLKTLFGKGNGVCRNTGSFCGIIRFSLKILADTEFDIMEIGYGDLQWRFQIGQQ